ncbi:hypothetical protein L1049_020287 [Liquidambar formosana]|uniref:Serine/threonine-protein kinase BSK1-like TPR repeats domain-containing protein n=1 Tax=Liquidambar formosana TaxID=63359 RepID=A0AAP0SCX2_LIQFO
MKDEVQKQNVVVPVLSPLSSSSSSLSDTENEDLQRMPLAPPLWKNRKRLTKTLSMCETPRDIAWEKRRRQMLRQERKRNGINDSDDLTDEDLHELKGCIELGFGFNEEGGQKLCSTLPALDLYFAVNRQLSPSPVSTPNSASSSSLGMRSSSFDSPTSESESWKICSPGDNPQQYIWPHSSAMCTTTNSKSSSMMGNVSQDLCNIPQKGCNLGEFGDRAGFENMREGPIFRTNPCIRQKVQQFLNAACTGNLDLFKKLAAELDDGKGLAGTVADVKDANKRGALHFAAREGKTEVCKYLLEELKLDVDTKDEDGETPLLHAARQGHTDTAKYLLEHGANPAIPSDLGATALHHSAGIGDIELLRFLLSKGVDVDSQSDAGTPLIWAAGHGQQDAVKVLLEHHADPNAETDDDITPLLSAVAAGSLGCLELLIQAGGNVNITAGGATPFHIAADNGSPEIINCLLQAGADPNVTDEDGQKPIQVAAARGNRRAVEILFPLTSPVQTVPDWTVDGILEYMQSETGKQQEDARNLMEANLPKDTILSKQDIPEVTPEAKKKAAEAKSRGDDAFKRKDYYTAVDAYTQAIDLDPTDAILLSNRSLCWIRLGQADHALADAKACRALRPDWPKACFREGAALRLLQKFDEAANSFYEGVKLDPENKELVNAFREAVEAGRKFHGTDQEKSSVCSADTWKGDRQPPPVLRVEAS